MKKIITILFALLALPSFATDKITASISFTNAAGTTNGQTITVNGNTRTWTNSVSAPLTQILTNSTAAGSKTNLYNALGSAGFAQTTITDQGSTNLNIVGNSGLAMSVSVSAGYASITLSTQTVSSAVAVRIPTTIEAAAQQTNINSGLVAAIDSDKNTNALREFAPAVANLVGLTSTQTVSGPKTFSNTGGRFAGQLTGFVSNSPGISGVLNNTTNGTNWSVTSVGQTNWGNFWLMGSDSSFIYMHGSNGIFSIYEDTDSLVDVAFGNVGCNYVNATNRVSSFYDWASGGGFVGDGTGLTNLVVNYGSVSNSTVQNVTIRGTNDFASADVAFRRYANTSLANGVNSAVLVGTNVFCQVSGPSGAFTIAGIAGGRDGKWVKIMNKTGQTMTFANESGGDPTAANRIQTGKTADVAYTNNPAIVTLIYDANASRWVIDVPQ